MLQTIVIVLNVARLIMAAPAPAQSLQNYGGGGGGGGASTLSPSLRPPPLDFSQMYPQYKSLDSHGNKVKKAYGSAEYMYAAAPESYSKHSYLNNLNNLEYGVVDEYSSTPGPGVISFPYVQPYVASYAKAVTPATTGYTPSYASKPVKEYAPQPVAHAANKIYIPDDHISHEKSHLIHDILGNKIHVVTGIVGPKVKAIGHDLETGHLDDSILHKLAFAKATALHLLGVLGPLSAAKTLKLTSHPPHHDVGYPGPLAPAAPPVAEDHIDHFEHYDDHYDDHHGSSLPSVLLHLVGHLSNAKLHFLPAIVKAVTYGSGHASASSSGSSSHGHH
jgi:hypothetical protein